MPEGGGMLDVMRRTLPGICKCVKGEIERLLTKCTAGEHAQPVVEHDQRFSDLDQWGSHIELELLFAERIRLQTQVIAGFRKNGGECA